MNAEKPKPENFSTGDPDFDERFSKTQEAMGSLADWTAEEARRGERARDAISDGAQGPELEYHADDYDYASMMKDLARRRVDKLADPRTRVQKLTDFVLRRNK